MIIKITVKILTFARSKEIQREMALQIKYAIIFPASIYSKDLSEKMHNILDW